jgi:hypothetical protein
MGDGRRLDWRRMTLEDFHVLEQLLWPSGSARDIWMIVDAARDRRIFGMLLDGFYSDHHCLFSGPLSSDLEVAAPYLIRLDHGSTKTQRFVTHAWGNSWGVFLKCGAGLTDLRSHLRELVTVRDPAGRSFLFRYYDPRVLRVYLPTCTPNELQTVFGDIECFWMEDGRDDSILQVAVDGVGLVMHTTPLAVSIAHHRP